MLSDLIVTVLKPNKACLISCCFIIINEITTWGQFNRNTARDILARSPEVTTWHSPWARESLQFEPLKLPSSASWKLTLSLHTLFLLCLSLFICSPWSTSLCFPLCLSLYQITSHRWLIRSASSSGNTDRSWRRWDESESGRRRRPTSRRNAGSDSAFFFYFGRRRRPIGTSVHVEELRLETRLNWDAAGRWRRCDSLENGDCRTWTRVGRRRGKVVYVFDFYSTDFRWC